MIEFNRTDAALPEYCTMQESVNYMQLYVSKYWDDLNRCKALIKARQAKNK